MPIFGMISCRLLKRNCGGNEARLGGYNEYVAFYAKLATDGKIATHPEVSKTSDFETLFVYINK